MNTKIMGSTEICLELTGPVKGTYKVEGSKEYVLRLSDGTVLQAKFVNTMWKFKELLRGTALLEYLGKQDVGEHGSTVNAGWYSEIVAVRSTIDWCIIGDFYATFEMDKKSSGMMEIKVLGSSTKAFELVGPAPLYSTSPIDNPKMPQYIVTSDGSVITAELDPNSIWRMMPMVEGHSLVSIQRSVIASQQGAQKAESASWKTDMAVIRGYMTSWLVGQAFLKLTF